MNLNALEALVTDEIPNENLSENGSRSSLKTDEISDESSTSDDWHPSPKARSPKRVGMALLGLALLVTLGFFGFHAVVKPKTGSGSGSARRRGRSRNRG